MKHKKIDQTILLQANTIFDTFRVFTIGQLNFLRMHGIKVVTVCSDAPGAYLFFRNEGAEYYPILIKRNISLFYDLCSFFRILRLLRRIKPDLLQGSTPKAAFLFLVAGWMIGLKSRIFFMRGVRSSGLTGAKGKIIKQMERISCGVAHRVLCTSPSVRDEIVHSGICPAHKAFVLANGTGNGIDTGYFSPSRITNLKKNILYDQLNIPSDVRVLLFVGRIVKDKGIVELAYAWSILRGHYRDIILIIVGKEEIEDPVPNKIIKTLKTDSRIHFIGETHDVSPYYGIADIFVLPTYREGIPIALLEASAMTLPVVATRVTGCIDAVIDGETGKLVPVKNFKAFASAIAGYLENDEMRKMHGENGRRMVIEKFGRENVWSSLLSEYKDLLAVS